MKHPARWAALTVGVVVAGLAVVIATQVNTNPEKDEQTHLIGKQVPAFTARTFNGQRVSAASLAGHAVLVNFWNSWCIPCQEELPSLKAFQQEHAGDPDVVLLGILRDDTVAAARPYAKAEGMTWDLVNDPSGNLSLDFGTFGQPENYAIAPDGVVVGTQFGPASTRNLDTLLAAAEAHP
jgi:cytochrome c biogenesis protein CcmG/thiol:disulfide interchange protein DsbE